METAFKNPHLLIKNFSKPHQLVANLILIWNTIVTIFRDKITVFLACYINLSLMNTKLLKRKEWLVKAYSISNTELNTQIDSVIMHSHYILLIVSFCMDLSIYYSSTYQHNDVMFTMIVTMYRMYSTYVHSALYSHHFIIFCRYQHHSTIASHQLSNQQKNNFFHSQIESVFIGIRRVNLWIKRWKLFPNVA